MSIVQRLQYIAKEKKTTFKEIERKTELANGSIRRWDSNSPSCDKIKKVAEYLNISIDWIITGKEESYTKEEIEIINAYRNATERRKESVKDILEIKNNESEQSLSSRTG